MFPCLPPSLSLVDKLPVELWSIIFSIYEEERRLELHRKALLPTTSSAYQLAVPPVSHVCIFWRNLILNTPSFWNTVWSRIWRSPSPGTMNLLRTYITRSRHAPRDIRVLVHRQHMAQQSDVLPLLKELFLKPETLRTVQIRLRYGSILNQLFPLCGTTNLEAFDLEVAMPDLEADLHPILKRTPRLKSFSVRGIIPTHASTFQTLIPWSSTHLEHVFLESNWRLARFEYMSDEVDHILSTCPTLQRLALRWCSPTTACTSITHPSLKSLDIWGCDGIALDPLSSWTFPNLHNFVLNELNLVNLPSNLQITSRFITSHPTIQILHLKGCRNMPILSILPKANTIRTLILTFSSFSDVTNCGGRTSYIIQDLHSLSRSYLPEVESIQLRLDLSMKDMVDNGVVCLEFLNLIPPLIERFESPRAAVKFQLVVDARDYLAPSTIQVIQKLAKGCPTNLTVEWAGRWIGYSKNV